MKMIRILFIALCALLPLPAMAGDCSGTITTGGTAQTITGINSGTRAVMLMNNSANLMCISISGVPATIAGTNCGAGSWTLQPGSATAAGGSYVSPITMPPSYLSIISAGTGDRFSCERQ